MKKIVFLLLFFTFGLMLAKSYAQYPIPSFRVPVDSRANFQEKNNIIFDKDSLVYGKRRICSSVVCEGSTKGECSATVWVFSLDGKDILGPFTVMGGTTLYVNIDDREWGVYVHTNDELTVSVWIESTPGDSKTELKILDLKYQDKDLLRPNSISYENILLALKWH